MRNGTPATDRFWLYTGFISLALVATLILVKFNDDGLCGTCRYFTILIDDLFYQAEE